MHMRKEVGFIGLGKMGLPMVQRLRKKGWRVLTFDISGNGSVKTIEEMVQKLSSQKIVFLMIPPGKPVDQVLFGKQGLLYVLKKGDIVIDGGNSFFKDSVRRAARLKRKGIYYLDTGISGGPISIKQGKFAIMVGGEKRVFEKAKPLFRALSNSVPGYMGKSGAGHFAKMVHNGIEYGMMQALGEGFAILRKSSFKFRLYDVADVYSQNSIITSRLVSWLKEGFREYGESLSKASGSVAYTGEGEWTVRTAKELKIPVPIIKGALNFRIQSKKNPSFTGRILSTLRAVFGGHKIR